jgi:hypothetical protein
VKIACSVVVVIVLMASFRALSLFANAINVAGFHE